MRTAAAARRSPAAMTSGFPDAAGHSYGINSDDRR